MTLVETVEDILNRACGCCRIDGHAGALAERADRLERAVEMRSRLCMDRNGVGPGRCEIGKIGIGRRDHQVKIERLFGARPDVPDHRRTEGDVRHEMSVHHIEMDPVGAGSVDRLDLLAEAGEIGGEDRGRDFEGLIHSGAALARELPPRRWSLPGGQPIP